jgi:hypothetical protein
LQGDPDWGGLIIAAGWQYLHITGSLQPIARIVVNQGITEKYNQIGPIHLRVDFGLTLLLDLLHDFDVDGRLRWHGRKSSDSEQ